MTPNLGATCGGHLPPVAGSGLYFFFFFLLAVPRSIWDRSSLTRDPASPAVEA